MLVVTNYFIKHELYPLRHVLKVEDVFKGAEKVSKGLAVEIKAPNNSGLRFFKVRVGMKHAARMIVFLITENQKIVPVLLRLKKDKALGMNMAMNNPTMVTQLHKNLNGILQDIKHKNYEEL